MPAERLIAALLIVALAFALFGFVGSPWLLLILLLLILVLFL